jgi:tellurite resistance protein
MEATEYKELLLKCAVCSIACDGDIDEREIEALKNIEKSSPYFSSLDLSTTLDNSLESCVSDLSAFKTDILNILKSKKLNVVQELSILEMALSIISADGEYRDAEKEFVNELRGCLEVEDFIITQRFGAIEILKPKVNEFRSSTSDPTTVEEIKKSK